ncbi:MAG: peptide/nickel transport system substrate-binding protein, partial [Baekduia sp.]|nr:peptide/nickel transport system substrate-binding protein [Baekduia sp.]
MSGNPLRFLVVSALATLALVVAACGGSSNSSSSSKTTTKSSAAAGDTPTTAGKKGGKLTMLAASDVDYLDPGHTYYTAGEQVDGAMGRTLYTIGP